MARLALSLATAFAIVGGSVNPALAQNWTAMPVAHNDVYAATTQLPLVNIGGCVDHCAIDDDCCDCCNTFGLIGSAEAVFLSYARADGTRVGVAAPGEDVDFDYEITPRLTLGWIGQSGLGGRIRYWEFDHAQAANEGGASNLSVDTYTIDFELFETFALSDNWNLEIAGGVRYNEFDENMTDDGDIRINEFHGFGGVASAELRRLVGARGILFTRARAAMLVDDKRIFNNDIAPIQNVVLNDVTVGALELAIGYDYVIPLDSGAYAFIRSTVEWQNWYDYSSSFTDLTNAERFAGPSDVSFHGFGIALGIMR